MVLFVCLFFPSIFSFFFLLNYGIFTKETVSCWVLELEKLAVKGWIFVEEHRLKPTDHSLITFEVSHETTWC